MKIAEIQKVVSNIKGKTKEKVEPMNQIVREFTWRVFINHYKTANNVGFKQTPESIINVSTVFNYFLWHDDFFKSPILRMDFNEPDFKKGLLLVGSYGNGKTSILRAFESVFKKYNYSNKFKIVNALDMVLEWEQIKDQEGKADFFHKYSTRILCIDDVKKERKASNYGISEIVGDVMLMRYNKGLKTHLTCNYVEGDAELNLRKSLEEFSRYGEHFYDRLFEMFNIIEFKGKSFRK